MAFQRSSHSTAPGMACSSAHQRSNTGAEIELKDELLFQVGKRKFARVTLTG